MQKILVRNAQTITVAGGKDYNDLENKPSINNVELEGNKTLHELGIQQEGSYATTSDLETKQDIITSSNKLSSDLVSGLSSVATSGSYNDLTNKPTIPSEVTETTVANWGFTKNTGDYTKPATGIPSTDLAEAVQTSLGKADTAIQDISGKQDIMQYSTMPTASSENVGKIAQFTGTTDSTYTNGYFYICVDNSGTYSWEQTNVQPAPSNVETTTNKVSSITSSSTNIEYAGAKAVWDLVSSVGGGLEFKGGFDPTTNFVFSNQSTGIYVPNTPTSGGYTLFRWKSNTTTMFVYVQPIMLIYYNKLTNDTSTSGTTKCAALLGLKTNNDYGKLVWYGIGLKNGTLTYTDDWQPQLMQGIINTAQTFAGVKTFGSIPQVSSYTAPTSDTQLTAKKYVDDKPTTYTGYDATKTQVLKNINGTLTWVDES